MSDVYKLYVVGECSGDPNKWSEWGSRVLAVARSPEEACELAGDLVPSYAAEVIMNEPCVLEYVQSPPSSF